MESLYNGTYQAPFIAHLGFLVTFFGKIVLGAVKPDRRKKIKTFPIWEQAASAISGNILQQFIEHQDELKRQIESAEELVSRGMVISSPASRMVVYKLETAFDIIVFHEQRHLEQAKEVLQRLTEISRH